MESVEELCEYIALIHKSEKILDGKLSDIKKAYKNNIFNVGLQTQQDGGADPDIGRKVQYRLVPHRPQRKAIGFQGTIALCTYLGNIGGTIQSGEREPV